MTTKSSEIANRGKGVRFKGYLLIKSTSQTHIHLLDEENFPNAKGIKP